MRLELTGRHVDITPSLRRLVDKKLARLERMLNDSALSAQVVLTGENAAAPRSRCMPAARNFCMERAPLPPGRRR